MWKSARASMMIAFALVGFALNDQAAAYTVAIDCDYGNDWSFVRPGMPNPSLFCEMTWSPGGLADARYGRIRSRAEVTVNPSLFKDSESGWFRLGGAPSVVAVSCSTLTTNVKLTGTALLGRVNQRVGALTIIDTRQDSMVGLINKTADFCFGSF
jgi:hypothetical protein